MKLSGETRELVARRARGACEYCHLPKNATVIPHQVDHIIGKQHGGSNELGNLCLCCIRCNLKKGPNLTSIDPETGDIVPLFHPRRESWTEHLRVGPDGAIQGLTATGRATVRLLEMNDTDRVLLRGWLLSRGFLF